MTDHTPDQTPPAALDVTDVRTRTRTVAAANDARRPDGRRGLMPSGGEFATLDDLRLIVAHAHDLPGDARVVAHGIGDQVTYIAVTATEETP